MVVAPLDSERPAEKAVRSYTATEELAADGASDREQVLEYYQFQDSGRAHLGNSYLQDTLEPDFSSVENFSMLRSRSAERDADREVHCSDVGRASVISLTSFADVPGVQRQSLMSGSGELEQTVETGSRYESKWSSLRPKRSYTESLFQVSSDQSHGLLGRRGGRIGGLTVDVHQSTQAGSSHQAGIPTSAPPTAEVQPIMGYLASNGHQRSMSDIQSFKKAKTGGSKASPRDIGIVGTLETMQATSPPSECQESSLVGRDLKRPTPDGPRGDCSLMAPVFQTPKSRSPSPMHLQNETVPPQAIEPLSSHSWTDSQLVPKTEQDTFESGSFRRSPNVIRSDLPDAELPTDETSRDTSRTTGRYPFKPNQTGLTYLHYQPGIHSTAGPLPSPPRHIFTNVTTSPPPRPPRLLSPSPITSKSDSDAFTRRSDKSSHSNALQAASGACLALAAASANSNGNGGTSLENLPKTLGKERAIGRSPSRDLYDNPQASSSRSSSHVREGAFPASSVFLPPPSQSPRQDALHDIAASVDNTARNEKKVGACDAPSPIVVEPLRVSKRSCIRPDLKLGDSWASSRVESLEDSPDETSPPSSYSSSQENSTHVTTIIISGDGRAKQKRLSLPAPPPDPQKRFHSLPRTPSLSFARSSSPTQPISVKKVPSSWPEAMNFREILIKSSAAERALAYAEKIRDLASEETGLGDWLLFSARKEPSRPRSGISSLPRGVTKHTRQVSRGSIASEVTFPIRADSYAATDLSRRPSTGLVSDPPSTILPYPSLAHGVGYWNHQSHTLSHSDSSSRGVAPSISSSRSLGGAFFASIGRKTSIKKDRSLGPTVPNKLISSRQITAVPQPRPVKIAASPTIPGGPRAPVRRANSFIPPPPSVENSPRNSQDTPIPPREAAASTDSQSFDRQVQKLFDLLPQADKDILAIYLRRANNHDPMLAIGAYLEDEKLGTLLKQ